MPATAAVVLAGGRSSRMGTPKAELEWYGSTLLRRVVGLVGRGADGPVVVVRAPGQPLPGLPPAVEVLDDAVEGGGPLQGIATGLCALRERSEHAFVCSTDLPLLHPAFVRAVCRAGQGVDVALPVLDGRRQPLAACYRTALGARATSLLAQGRGRPVFLLEGADVRELDEQALLADALLAQLDPTLASVTGTNTPEEYTALRDQPAPAVTVQCFGVLASGGSPGQSARRSGGQSARQSGGQSARQSGGQSARQSGGQSGERTVRAATLGAAARAVDLVLDRHVLAAVNGDQMVRDPELPLAAGDVVAFLSADAGG